VVAALIVDDDEPIRTMLGTIARAKGFDVDTASDGQEAIEKLESGRFDVIVLDLMMPRVNGYDVLQHIAVSRPELLERVIIATAVPEREVRREITQPVFGVHIKPFELSRLLTDMRLCAKAS
jgi:two-component system alkaline phosphatase synthesis response regulator PhoP